jgi:hypothetical protein
MRVADGEARRISRVGTRQAGKFQEAFHHFLRLFFGRLAVADDGCFPLKRGGFRHPQINHHSGHGRTAVAVMTMNQRIAHEVRAHRAAHAPADDARGEHVDDTRRVKPRAGRSRSAAEDRDEARRGVGSLMGRSATPC